MQNASLVSPIKDFSSLKWNFSSRKVHFLKQGNYRIKPERISGDAPKDLIQVYEFGRCNKSEKSTWIKYIAKVGHKRYPSESITEQLISELGNAWGINVAKSKLCMISGQLRFCSEFFRGKDQELIHGADILARYLQEADASIIEQIDQKGWSQEMLTFNFVKDAIYSVFPRDAKVIIREFVKMLLFDAIVGNNDRHFFNWGVLRDLRGKETPYFSPIYDTARGLFWNYSDLQLTAILSNKKQLNSVLKKYFEKSKPKVGWEGLKEINHSVLVEKLLSQGECETLFVRNLFSQESLFSTQLVLNTRFDGLISDERKQVIQHLIDYRIKEFMKQLNMVL